MDQSALYTPSGTFGQSGQYAGGPGGGGGDDSRWAQAQDVMGGARPEPNSPMDDPRARAEHA